jgi:predicted Zn finger-like uncharacterized protein
MLIVCPSCSTSYMIDPASLGQAGRTVRCARCRGTWFEHPPGFGEPVEAFVDGVIAEAELAERRVEAAFTSGEHEPVVYVGESESPVHIEEAPSLVPPMEEASGYAVEDEPAAEPAFEETESFAARRRRLHDKRQKARQSSRWTAVVLGLLAFNVALIGARAEVVKYLPQTASLFAAVGLPVNLRQLTFEDVHVSRETQSGNPMLSIEGKIVSKASHTVEVPRLRFAARNTEGREVYSWTARPERNVLQPGESLTFRSFAKPPEDAVDILVRFFNVQDAIGGS